MKEGYALSESLIKRISLLKFFLKEVEKYLKETTDEYAFSVGVSLLHDAIENLFWAIETKDVGIKDKQAIHEKYEVLITEKRLKTKICFDKTSLVELGTIRGSFKHKGILPNIQQTVSITNKLLRHFNETVYKLFNIDINTISLSILIKNIDVKESIQNIERKLQSDKLSHIEFREALIKIGKIFFENYEKNNLNSLSILIQDLDGERLGKRKKRYLFAEKSVDDIYKDLLEIGMVPYYYYRFKNLVPSYGLDRNNNKTIPKMSTVHWGKENWTKLNTEFCLNWLIEYVLRRERVFGRKDYDVKSPTSREHIFEVVENTTIELIEYETLKRYKFSLQKGVLYLGNFLYYVGGDWQDYSEEESDRATLVFYTQKGRFHGEVPKTLFNIKEIHMDEISQTQTSLLLRSGDLAMKVV
ncbi:MAG: hypothetical protein WC489_01295 [Patescibacteria group bacterium]